MMAAIKDVFYDKLDEIVKSSTERSVIMNAEKYETLLQETKHAQLLKKNNQSLTSKQYRRLKRYDILKVGNSEKLVEYATDSTSSRIRYYCKTDELFDVLDKAHTDVGHKGSRIMENELKKQYCNITRAIINLYLSLCEQCRLKKKIPSRGLVENTDISDIMKSKCQVSLIDMQSEPDNEYRFILNYQDHKTKFTILRPLKTQTAEEVACQLLDIFCLFGAPNILESDGGRIFATKLFKNLYKMWPGMKLVHGKRKYFQSLDSPESSQDIRGMLTAWRADNNSQNWSQGLRIIQSIKNRSLHSELNTSPHEAMFGTPQKMGLADSCIPTDVYASIETEEDLQELLLSAVKNDVQENRNTTENDEELSNVNTLQKSNVDEVTKVKQELIDTDDEENINESANKNCITVNVEKLKICVLCEKETSETYKCSECNENIHLTCGVSLENETFGANVMCKLCSIKNSINVERECANSDQKKQAKKKTSAPDSKFPEVKIGSNVSVRVSEVENGRVSLRNVLCVVMSINASGHYKLGNKEGLTERLFTRNEFTLSEANFISIYDVPLNSPLTLNPVTVLGQEGLVMCHCRRYCIDKKCKCRSNNVKCNPKCHSNSSCKNK